MDSTCSALAEISAGNLFGWPPAVSFGADCGCDVVGWDAGDNDVSIGAGVPVGVEVSVRVTVGGGVSVGSGVVAGWGSLVGVDVIDGTCVTVGILVGNSVSAGGVLVVVLAGSVGDAVEVGSVAGSVTVATTATCFGFGGDIIVPMIASASTAPKTINVHLMTRKKQPFIS